jgi:hypothetical protein
MAKPVITSVTPAGPITAQAGTVVTVKAVAQDADARTETWQIVPFNTANPADRGTPQSLTLIITDPIAFEVTGPAGSPTTANVQPDGTITFVV